MTPLLTVAFALAVGPVDARVQAAADAIPAEAVLVLDVATGQPIARSGKIDRALPPGSTFKLVVAIAAAASAEGNQALATPVTCAGRARQSGRDVKCWRPTGHGELTLEDAITHSCNIYFGAVGERVGTPSLVATARALAVGTGGGRLPEASAPAALVADGVGVLVTARQLGQLMVQIATGRRGDGKPLASPAILGRLRAGMRSAVERGTAQGAASSVAVAGKTGTSDLGAGSIGWFIGYAPADDPTVAVVIARRDASGAETAKSAPALFEAFFHGRQ